MLNQFNRLMAIFLKTYPGYTRETMLEEYAITVITLIDEAVKLDAAEKLANIQTSSIPYMKKRDANSVVSYYQRIVESKRTNTTSSDGIRKLKELMR